jgi:cellulose biosynthesis protein BcsQ
MISIVVFNNKGGVGKTTFLCNLGAYFNFVAHKRVLVVDADPQCNATVYCLPEPDVQELYTTPRGATIDAFFDPLRRGKGYLGTQYRPLTTPRFGFDLVPGDPKLALSEDLLASDWTSGSSGDPRGLQTSFVFKDLLYKLRNYDIALFDVGPSLGALNRSVLIASDFFLMPMSSDIFSVMAISNIATALKKWRRSLNKGLADYETEEGQPYVVAEEPVSWRLQFLGYVTQQYTAKRVRGVRQPVSAYDKILRRAPALIKKELIENFSSLGSAARYKLGEIPNLHSVVPLSQSAHAPIFRLRGTDGVVGAHFAKVKDTEKIYAEIATQIAANLETRV